jgi:hypothetical protein
MNPARKKKQIMHLKIGMDTIIQGISLEIPELDGE